MGSGSSIHRWKNRKKQKQEFYDIGEDDEDEKKKTKKQDKKEKKRLKQQQKEDKESRKNKKKNSSDRGIDVVNDGDNYEEVNPMKRGTIVSNDYGDKNVSNTLRDTAPKDHAPPLPIERDLQIYEEIECKASISSDKKTYHAAHPRILNRNADETEGNEKYVSDGRDIQVDNEGRFHNVESTRQSRSFDNEKSRVSDQLSKSSHVTENRESYNARSSSVTSSSSFREGTLDNNGFQEDQLLQNCGPPPRIVKVSDTSSADNEVEKPDFAFDDIEDEDTKQKSVTHSPIILPPRLIKESVDDTEKDEKHGSEGCYMPVDTEPSDDDSMQQSDFLDDSNSIPALEPSTKPPKPLPKPEVFKAKTLSPVKNEPESQYLMQTNENSSKTLNVRPKPRPRTDSYSNQSKESSKKPPPTLPKPATAKAKTLPTVMNEPENENLLDNYNEKASQTLNVGAKRRPVPRPRPTSAGRPKPKPPSEKDTLPDSYA